jgi:hypothetical protein
MMQGLSHLPPASQVRSIAKTILEHPKFGRHDSETAFGHLILTLKEFMSDSLLWVIKLLSRLFNHSPVLFFFVITVLVIVLVAIIGHIIYTIYQAMKKLPGASPYVASASDFGDPVFLEKQAELARDRGDNAEGIRLLLMAALLRIELENKSRLHRGSTNREYLRRFKNTPISDPLRTMVDLVDARWYGLQECTPGDYEECRRAGSFIADWHPAQKTQNG